MATLRYWDVTANAWVAMPAGPQGPAGAAGPAGGVGPQGPAGAAYVAKSASAPNPSAPPVNPPDGLLWLDTVTVPPVSGTPPTGPAGGDLKGSYPNPTVGMNLPAPLAAGVATTSFQDDLGDYWIANGNVAAGVWKRCRDVLYLRVYRNAAYTLAAAQTAIPWDTVATDNYGMWSSANSTRFTPPVPGLWLLQTHIQVAGVAVGGWIQSYPLKNNAQASGSNITQAGSAGSTLILTYSEPITTAAGDYITVGTWMNSGLAAAVGANGVYATFTYLGTG